MRLLFDFADRDVVTVCPCGWRSLALTRKKAREAAAYHQHYVHPGDREMGEQIRTRFDPKYDGGTKMQLSERC